MNNSHFVSAQWLKDHLDDENLVIIDATAPPPPQQIDCRQLWLDTHIPGAQFFDLDKIADHQNGLPHMLPDPQTFSQSVGAMGISENHLVVIYDQGNMFSAPRAWWTFKVLGSHNVRILDGGLQSWQQAGFPTESGEVTRSPQTFHTNFDASRVKSLEQILASLNDPRIQIVDARAADRFQAKAPEPRPGLRMGHIPGSKNVPWTMLVANGHFKSATEIADIFLQQHVDLNKPIITSCGSGMTAAVLVLGLDIIGKKDVYLYDGSWAEWGADDILPLEK
ncbi:MULTISPECIES: 3-mercaptopyruvate sulfurtransferase [Photorhabdus]|uniref:Sulfurtransferase n=2 Tax=Photorhabdus asymbiotica TaxID=291112 RepID=C7BR49_PHOAA|nr:3-mercaptopyruvate sulfurtransferase [Photorhabdus asymbiotica]RKS56623.1 thiosulfate/3-mercaptopyruvate sulfurtransferase [Photorhabdus asymbiotica]CAQ85004.1 3-mercaptopyruvate:cyanide sulfurtransferase [Photorhabdus asymbiotica]